MPLTTLKKLMPHKKLDLQTKTLQLNKVIKDKTKPKMMYKLKLQLT